MHSELPISIDPVVSIVMLTWNGLQHTRTCIDSIRLHTTVPYELIVVDNGSTDGTLQHLSEQRDVLLIRNRENRGFGPACNQAAEYASGRFLLFLNNDTIVTEEWLQHMVHTMDAHPQCGIVGAKLVHMDGSLQELGGTIHPDGSAEGYGRGDNPNSSAYCSLCSVDYCSGACLLIRRNLFTEIGGFDERYSPAYYEDVDLCLTVRARGYSILCQPLSVIQHAEYGSSSAENAVELMQKNAEIFRKKWSGAFPEKPDTKRILYIDDRIPTTNQGMGFTRAHTLVHQLCDLGYDVTCFPLQSKDVFQPFTDELRQRGIIVVTENVTLPAWLAAQKNAFDLIIVSRPHNMRQTTCVLERYLPDTPLLYDAEALFGNRTAQLLRLRNAPLASLRGWSSKRRELSMVSAADSVLAVTDLDAAEFARVAGRERVHVWGYPTSVHRSAVSHAKRNGLLFIGGLLPYSPNEEALTWFLQEIYPRILSAEPMPLRIIGMSEHSPLRAYASEYVQFLGQVDDLVPYYDSSRVFIAPSRIAAGIPCKVYGAMAHGIPSVVTPILAEEIGNAEPCSVAGTAEQFAEEVLRLSRDEELWQRRQQAGYAHVERVSNPDRMKATLKEIIDGLLHL